MEFRARNTNGLQGQVYDHLKRHGIPEDSRNGPVLRLRGVTTITLQHPWERVNFSPARDANPFFHLFEAVAMFAGAAGNDVPLLGWFAKNMLMFSDDGKRYNAFYGERIRDYGRTPAGFINGFDQFAEVISLLKADRNTRQALVQIWDPYHDLNKPTKDKACNLCLIFSFEGDQLVMTSFNRSNDAIWGGVTGANIVHLSFFHEYVACAVGAQMGSWYHSSANLHVYTDRDKKWDALVEEGKEMDKLLYPDVLYPLFDHGMEDRFTASCRDLVELTRNGLFPADGLGAREAAGPLDPEFPRVNFDDPFISTVAYPMTMAYICWKQYQRQLAYDWLKTVRPGDWAFAGLCWFKRREGVKYSPHTFGGYETDFIAAQ